MMLPKDPIPEYTVLTVKIPDKYKRKEPFLNKMDEIKVAGFALNYYQIGAKKYVMFVGFSQYAEYRLASGLSSDSTLHIYDAKTDRHINSFKIIETLEKTDTEFEQFGTIVASMEEKFSLEQFKLKAATPKGDVIWVDQRGSFIALL